MNWNKKQLGVLIKTYNDDMAELNKWCHKRGIDFAPVITKYKARLIEFGANLALEDKQ